MKAREARMLTVGQIVEFSDGRIATVEKQDTDNQEVTLRFQDEVQISTGPNSPAHSERTGGILKWVDMFTVELPEISPREGNG